MQLKDVTPIIKAILEERDKIPRIIDTERYIPNPQPYHDGDCMRAGIRKALRVIEQAPVVATAPRWIPVEERLPEETGAYVVYGKGRIAFGTFYSSIQMWVSNIETAITHWMPLPEPPKEEN